MAKNGFTSQRQLAALRALTPASEWLRAILVVEFHHKLGHRVIGSLLLDSENIFGRPELLSYTIRASLPDCMSSRYNASSDNKNVDFILQANKSAGITETCPDKNRSSFLQPDPQQFGRAVSVSAPSLPADSERSIDAVSDTTGSNLLPSPSNLRRSSWSCEDTTRRKSVRTTRAEDTQFLFSVPALNHSSRQYSFVHFVSRYSRALSRQSSQFSVAVVSPVLQPSFFYRLAETLAETILNKNLKKNDIGLKDLLTQIALSIGIFWPSPGSEFPTELRISLPSFEFEFRGRVSPAGYLSDGHIPPRRLRMKKRTDELKSSDNKNNNNKIENLNQDSPNSNGKRKSIFNFSNFSPPGKRFSASLDDSDELLGVDLNSRSLFTYFGDQFYKINQLNNNNNNKLNNYNNNLNNEINKLNNNNNNIEIKKPDFDRQSVVAGENEAVNLTTHEDKSKIITENNMDTSTETSENQAGLPDAETLKVGSTKTSGNRINDSEMEFYSADEDEDEENLSKNKNKNIEGEYFRLVEASSDSPVAVVKQNSNKIIDNKSNSLSNDENFKNESAHDGLCHNFVKKKSNGDTVYSFTLSDNGGDCVTNSLRDYVSQLFQSAAFDCCFGSYHQTLDFTDSFIQEPASLITDVFKDFLPCLLSLWEAVVTGKSVFLFSKDPQQSSKAVLAAASLIYPLVYRGDLRPLIGTAEPDLCVLMGLSDNVLNCLTPKRHPSLSQNIDLGSPTSPNSNHKNENFGTNRSCSSTFPPLVYSKAAAGFKGGALFGATNPIFLTTLKNISCMCALSVPFDPIFLPSKLKQPSFPVHVCPSNKFNHSGSQETSSGKSFIERQTSQSGNRKNESGLLDSLSSALWKSGKHAYDALPRPFKRNSARFGYTTRDISKLDAQTPTEWWPKSESYTGCKTDSSAETPLVDWYLNLGQSSVFSFEQSYSFSDALIKNWNLKNSSRKSLEEIFRQAFTCLTEDFLRPFDPYTKMDVRPLMLNPFQYVTELPTFNVQLFLKSLSTGNGTFRSLSVTRLLRLYENFIETSTFIHWLDTKRKQAASEMNTVQIKFCLSSSDTIIPSLANVELTEGIDRLSQLAECEEGAKYKNTLTLLKQRLEKEHQSRSRAHDQFKQSDLKLS